MERSDILGQVIKLIGELLNNLRLRNGFVTLKNDRFVSYVDPSFASVIWDRVENDQI
jgi:hypothetical protein